MLNPLVNNPWIIFGSPCNQAMIIFRRVPCRRTRNRATCESDKTLIHRYTCSKTCPKYQWSQRATTSEEYTFDKGTWGFIRDTRSNRCALRFSLASFFRNLLAYRTTIGIDMPSRGLRTCRGMKICDCAPNAPTVCPLVGNKGTPPQNTKGATYTKHAETYQHNCMKTLW